MPDKKRKNESANDPRSAKKKQLSGDIEVEYVDTPDVLRPVIASSPGINLPEDLSFDSYASTKQNGPPALLLHSTSHPTIDYTATEGTTAEDDHVKHYIAVLDPATQKLRITEARKLVVRSSLRQRKTADDSDVSENEDPSLSQTYVTRSDLTEAFGSKKSKKAVQTMAENRQLGQGGAAGTIANAMISKLGDEDDEDLASHTDARANKPLPVPNLNTTDVAELYSLTSLMSPKPARNTLKTMQLSKWISSLDARKDITGIRSRFVANRIGYLGKKLLNLGGTDEKYLQQCQLLRYIELLLVMNHYLSKQSRAKKFPFVDKWPADTLPLDTSPTLVKQFLSDFFPGNMASNHQMTLLRATILALTLHILPPSGTWGSNVLAVEPFDIAQDLSMDVVDVKRLYRELGCKLESAKEKDLAVWGLEKTYKKKKGANGLPLPAPQFAKLRMPPEFPKVSSGRARGSR